MGDQVQANQSLQQPAEQINSKTRPKLYKIKKELDEYFYLCMDHREILTIFYDYYMDNSPATIKKLFNVLFQLNKFTRQLLVYCLLYHSIWWTTTSATSSSNENRTDAKYTNKFIFYIIFYFNFYELIVQHLFIKIVCFNLFKSFHLCAVQRLKAVLNFVEFLVYLLVSFVIFYILKFEYNYSIHFINLIMLPHIFFLFYNHFDINITLFNYTLFTNQPEKPAIAQTDCATNELGANNSNSAINQEVLSNNSTNNSAFVYTDCSNLSLNTFLSPKISLPNVLAANPTIISSTTTQNFQIGSANTTTQAKSSSNLAASSAQVSTYQIIKQSLNRTRSPKYKFSAFGNFVSNFLNSFLKFMLGISLAKLKKIVSNAGSTSRIHVIKRNTFSYISKNDSHNYLQHKCQKDANNLREETELFKCEYNNRLKEALMRTFESIYFNFVISRLCVPSIVNIREKEYYLYFFSSLISIFVSYCIYYIPLSLLVSFNRNSEHLGSWRLLEDKSQSKQAQTQTQLPKTLNSFSTQLSNDVNRWINTKIYYRGDKVFYKDKVYVVDTVCSSSVPGNKLHYCFFRLFSDPFRITLVFFVLELVNIVLLFSYLVMNKKWYAILTIFSEMLINCHVFFILSRDFFILRKTNNINLKKFY